MTGTGGDGGLSPSGPKHARSRRRSEVTPVNTTLLHLPQTAAAAVAPRPKATARVATAALCTGTTVAYGKAPKTVIGNGISGSWLATTRLSMTVPAFHDRRPLCSTT